MSPRTAGERAVAERARGALPDFTPGWFLLEVRYRSEKSVASALSRKGFEVFLPTILVKREWSDRVKEVEFPLFPCYMFCRFPPKDRLSVVCTPNVLSGLGSGRHPIPVPDSDVAALRRILASGFDVQPWPYPTSGQVVRISRDPLRDVEGIVVRETDTCRLVMRIAAVQSAISAKIPPELLCAG